jgi:hypothetical protein
VQKRNDGKHRNLRRLERINNSISLATKIMSMSTPRLVPNLVQVELVLRAKKKQGNLPGKRKNEPAGMCSGHKSVSHWLICGVGPT